MRSTSAWRGRDPGLHRLGAGAPVADHRGGEPALGIADRIERAIEREPVEIVRDHDIAHGAGDAVEPEEGFGREIGRGHLGDRLAGAVGHQHDIGRRRQHRQTGDAARQLVRHARLAQARPRALARGGGRFRQRVVERGLDLPRCRRGSARRSPPAPA